MIKAFYIGLILACVSASSIYASCGCSGRQKNGQYITDNLQVQDCYENGFPVNFNAKEAEDNQCSGRVKIVDPKGISALDPISPVNMSVLVESQNDMCLSLKADVAAMLSNLSLFQAQYNALVIKKIKTAADIARMKSLSNTISKLNATIVAERERLAANRCR